MRKFYILIFLTCATQSFSQVTFEKGYLINESDQRIECLIKNFDWENTPSEFRYILANDSAIYDGTLANIKEFGIYNSSKFVRSIVSIDQSSDRIDRLDYNKNPNYKEATVFLKVLIEGKASLYLYKGNGLIRFFYSIDSNGINPLVYKRYLVDNSNKKINQPKFNESIVKNNFYKQQLYLHLNCPEISAFGYEQLEYSKKSLENFFCKYNTCANSPCIKPGINTKKDLFNLTLLSGVSYSNLTIENSLSDNFSTDFGGAMIVNFGLELEYIFPFFKNKWSIITAPKFQYYNKDKTTNTNTIFGGEINTSVKYQSIELPLGLRHSFYLKAKSKITVDFSYLIDIPFNSSGITFERADNSQIIEPLTITSNESFVLGAGYKYNDKYFACIKYHLDRDILGGYTYWSGNYQTISLIFGYTLF